ncbi:hypothetical protein [Xylella fastidiosa]|uniref:hypothetical protein n=1 Tax=Xylella fastidiosa TaxID=2371 RepID=UPI001180670C|nr:hypothetical protein [Xylella fastidiosa]MDG5823936.1 hypothetical protein [Xylella fastidiosa subsp. pauca]MDG5824792.1 hypothetical protein [Xylella fastidiosa subsp. pauca]QPB73298.1 hypothetical protein XFC3_12815 [Xylella fastidiosa]WGZ32708.1 hypothetical protein O4444_03605 [Xylella fastidiosa subsp. pauca]WGZ35033.1 hypothetical protein O4445_03860 [Xylella fastidiosa subsp. pauca]
MNRTSQSTSTTHDGSILTAGTLFTIRSEKQCNTCRQYPEENPKTSIDCLTALRKLIIEATILQRLLKTSLK